MVYWAIKPVPGIYLHIWCFNTKIHWYSPLPTKSEILFVYTNENLIVLVNKNKNLTLTKNSWFCFGYPICYMFLFLICLQVFSVNSHHPTQLFSINSIVKGRMYFFFNWNAFQWSGMNLWFTNAKWNEKGWAIDEGDEYKEA